MYMLHGLWGQTGEVPTCLYPTPMSQYEPNPMAGVVQSAKPQQDEDDVSLRPTTTKSAKPAGTM